MSKLSRYTQQLFGTTGLVGTGGFGAAAAGTTTTENPTSSTPATLMGTTEFSQGWISAVLGGSKFPAIEDMNALEYATTYQLAYLFQQGIPEYDSGTTYYINSICLSPGTLNLYASLTNNNVGNSLSTTADWEFLGNLSNLAGSFPEQLVTGTNATPSSAYSTYYTTRSNSGTAMTDTFPGTSGALANGEFGWYKNVDSTASLTLTVGSGGTINSGNLTGNLIILPGELWFWQSQGSGVYNIQRISSAVLHAAPVVSGAKNLAHTWTSTTAGAIAADEIILEDSNGNTRKVKTFSASYATGTSGIGGLDTGSIAASTWYYAYAAFDPATGVQGVFISLSATSPTVPSGYSFIALIGVLRTDSSSHIIGFTQHGNKWNYVVGNNLSGNPVLISGSQGSINTPTYVSAATGSAVPPNATIIKLVVSMEIGTASSDTVIIAPNSSYGTTNGTTNQPITSYNGASLGAHGSWFAEMQLESTNVYYAADNASSALACYGFELNLK